MFFKPNSFSDVLKHIAVIFLIILLMLFAFFYVWLPNTTNHGETITVPKVTGLKMQELEGFLEDKDLRYLVNDSSYNPELQPFVVLTQEPQPGAKVKKDRKIYVSVNMKNPPEIKMPKLVDGSVKNAQMILKSYDLRLGKIEYVPDLAQNAVLKQLVNGKEIKPGALIKKGAVVDLVVGDGLGNAEFEVPSVTDMPVDEATVLLVGNGLTVGNIIYTEGSGKPSGTVVKQRPEAAPGKTIRSGEIVDLWVAGREPVRPLDE